MIKYNYPLCHCSGHTREGRYPVHPAQGWIPAFVGMTTGKLFLAASYGVVWRVWRNWLRTNPCRLATAGATADLMRLVGAVVSSWWAHFVSVGVAPADVSALADQIDRPFLLLQREQSAQKT